MSVLRSFMTAVSMYSRIPIPKMTWEEKDMQYVFCFFPWIGAVIGICIYGWNALCRFYDIGDFCRVAVMAAVPLLLTGGIHVDGFMDTMDAMHSYQTKERKLEILKDAHIGAFAVIMLAVYGLIFLGALSEIGDGAALSILCCGFFLSRCLCGISAVSFPLAKKDGMLRLFVNNARRRTVKFSLYLQGVICVAVMLYCSLAAGLLAAAAALLSFGYYCYKSKKEFDGITGDTAGYFILLCEGWMTVAAAMAQFLF